MAYNEGSLVLGFFFQLVQDLLFRFGIDSGKTIVKEVDLRVLEEGACNGNPLFLSPAQGDAPFAQNSFILLVKAHNIPMNYCLLGYGNNFLIGRVFLSKFNIVLYGIRKKESILGYCSYGLS